MKIIPPLFCVLAMLILGTGCAAQQSATKNAVKANRNDLTDTPATAKSLPNDNAANFIQKDSNVTPNSFDSIPEKAASQTSIIPPAPDAQSLVQIGRYSAIHPIPTLEQQYVLQVIIKVILPEEIDTIGQAVQYLLLRSGYQLAPPIAQGPKVVQLLTKKLPQIHRELGPMSLENALLTLTSPSYRLQKDPVHRLIAFELTPEFSMESSL